MVVGWSKGWYERRAAEAGADVFEALPAKHRALLEQLEAKYPDAGRGVLLGYLKHRDWNVSEACAQFEATALWRKSLPKTSIADVAPFMLYPPGCEGPDGCIVCLEDMKGDCARDHKGRPIIANIGMVWGGAVAMQRQVDYAIQRALLYIDKTQEVGVCNVVEVIPRKGCRPTFRFPDKDVRSILDMQRNHYPSMLGHPTHFCGIPRAITWAFALTKPFMAKVCGSSERCNNSEQLRHMTALRSCSAVM